MAKKAKDKKVKTTAVGRPTKIHAFLKVFKEQMAIKKVAQQVIFLTDAEMIFLINELLPQQASNILFSISFYILVKFVYLLSWLILPAQQYSSFSATY